MSKLIVLGDILKSEADPKSRISIQAPTGTKIGQLVKLESRKQYLVALSDEVHGKVLVQPQNCVMNLDVIQASDITNKRTGNEDNIPLSVELLKKEGDMYGIQYVGNPIT